MAAEIAAVVSFEQAAQAQQVVAGIAFRRRRNDGGGPAHDVVGGEERVAVAEAEMVERMTGRVQGGEAADGVAFAEVDFRVDACARDGRVGLDR